MNPPNLVVTLERDGKTVVVLLRADDFAQSVHRGKMRWGSGRAWTVLHSQPYDEAAQ